MRIGHIIQQLREEAKMLQSDLAKALGLGRTTISSYETNKSYPDLDTLIAISHFFHVSTDYLLGLTDFRQPLDEITEEDTKILYYYQRLNTENQDLIVGEMVKLYREQEKTNSAEKNTG